MTSVATTTASTRAFLHNLFASISHAGFGETFLEALAENVIWTATGDSPLGGRYESKSEYVTKVLQPLHDRLATPLKPEVEQMLVDGEWASVLFRSKNVRGHNGADFSMQYCWIIRVVDGSITEVVSFYDQKKMYDLFA